MRGSVGTSESIPPCELSGTDPPGPSRTPRAVPGQPQCPISTGRFGGDRKNWALLIVHTATCRDHFADRTRIRTKTGHDGNSNSTHVVVDFQGNKCYPYTSMT
jgi:hypothetical protein